MPNIRPSPLACAIALALAGTQGSGSAFAAARSETSLLRLPAPVPSASTADGQVTVIADDWDDEDAALLDFAGLDEGDPFAMGALDEDRITVLAASGRAYGPSAGNCAKYGGVAKLSVSLVPQGGVIYGGGLNCGKSVSKANGSRVCFVKTCKAYGDQADLRARPDEGFEFVKWKQACKAQKNDPYCTVALDQQRAVSAKFRRKPQN